MRTVQRSWIRTGFELGALILLAASGLTAAASTAAVSGVVRDAQGVTQMGALVEVLSADTASVGTTFTDLHGRYRIENLQPGRYAVRATAALFVPAIRENLRLATGMRATVNLTLNTLSDPTAWLPAERRKVDEPGDDWTWTLRSAANRPILRMIGDGSVVLASADSAGSREDAHRAPVQARASVSGGNGGFGQSGVRSVLDLDRAMRDGADAMLRLGLATTSNAAATTGAAATKIVAGYERQSGLGRESRMVASYESHPDIRSIGFAGAGLQTARMLSAERLQLGDMVEVEAGSAMVAIHMSGAMTQGFALAAQPFVRVTIHPLDGWSVTYRMATARDLQGFDGLSSIAAATPAVTACGAKLCTESGTHQEIGVSRRAGGGTLEAAIYRDSIDRTAIAGVGATSVADLAGSDALVDTATGSFRFLSAGYTANGVSFTLSAPLSASLWAALEYESGAAMAANSTNGTPQLHNELASAATVALRVQYLRPGTNLRVAYRWQPHHLLTTVGPYADLDNPTFFSFELRQSLRCGDFLPSGFEATINITNLLAEGYQPYLSSDGRTLYLATTPRTIRGGLSFTF